MPERLRVADLKPGSSDVELLVRVVSVGEPKTAGAHTLSMVKVADETGAVSLALWDEQVGMLQEGQTVRIRGAYVRVFRGRMQLALGRRGRIGPVDVELKEVNTLNDVSERTVPVSGQVRRR
ncbi:MAG: hypothetical protein QXE23_02485 [Nitrososphaerota archaeon]